MATFFEQWLDRRMRSTTKKNYIEFVDPVVAQICANNWGDGIGITYAQAARVTNLGGAFQNNTSIVSFDELQYFTGITTFNYYANTATGTFSGCTNLVSVVLPSSARTLYSTFKGCTKLQSVGSLENITTLTHSPFMDCTSLAITVYMPNLTSISDHAFIRSGVTSVTSLGSITAMSGGTYNDQGIFRDCTSLTSVVLPSTLTSIGTNTFRGCSSLATISLPTSITAIGATAFVGSIINCSVNLPNLTSLGLGAFYGTKITSIISLGSVTSILGGTSNQQGSFMNCVDLVSAVLPSTVTSIGINAFNGCSSLTTINLPTSITTISQYAFLNTKINCSINLPNLTSIGLGAFYGTKITSIQSLGSITSVPGGTSNNQGPFMNCSDLTSVVLPSTLTSIGINAFRECASLTSVQMENSLGLTSIAASAFYRSNQLRSIIIPSGITSIGNSAFQTNNNPNVDKTYICLNTTPPTISSNGGNIFHNYSGAYSIAKVSIYVPYSSDHSVLNTYQTASGWTTYASRIFELDQNGNIPT